jgi:glutamate-1-semialdehyde 2,1-aminomutase
MARRRYTKSSKLFQRAQQVLVGGVNSPVRAFTSVGASPLFITGARGARIIDADGNDYIDYVMSWGPMIHGHSPRGLVKILAKTASHGTSFGAPTELEIALGERVRR